MARILRFSEKEEKEPAASRKDEKTKNKASILKKKGMQCPVDTPSSNNAFFSFKQGTPISLFLASSCKASIISLLGSVLVQIFFSPVSVRAQTTKKEQVAKPFLDFL